MELVKFNAADGLEIDGAFSGTDSDQACVIHVHGKCGNFYQNAFIHRMLSEFPQSRVSFLSFNNRGHDCIAEGYINGELHYTGGSIESFAQSQLDITASLDYVADRLPGRPVFLQGHSNGCEKVLYYVRRTPPTSISGVILLSVADSRLLHERYIAPRTIQEQIHFLESMESGFQLLSILEYGVSTPAGKYFIPSVRDSLLELLTSDAMELVRFTDGWAPSQLQLPAFAYVGTRDPLTVVSAAAVRTTLQKVFRSLECLVLEDGDHHFHGAEDEVVGAITRWILSVTADKLGQ